MSRFVFLPVDSECDQLVKQRDTECGSGGGGCGGDGGGRLGVGGGVGGPSLFHRESLWPSTESERDEREKNGAGYNIMNVMTNKRTFQSFRGCFPLTRATQLQRLHAEPLKGQDVSPFFLSLFFMISKE